MKSLISYFLFFIAGLCSSCSSDIIKSDNKKICNDSEILSQITFFNDSLLRTKIVTRGSTENSLYWMSVISADCAGAYEGGRIGAKCGMIIGHPHAVAAFGALVAGSWASYKVHRTLTRSSTSVFNEQVMPVRIAGALIAAKEQDVDISDNFSTEITLPLSNEKIKEIGAKHNIVLQNLIDENIDIENLAKYLSKEELELIQSEDFRLDCENAIANIHHNFNSGNAQQTENITISDKLMSLFYNIYQKYPSNYEDAQLVINKYVEVVKNTTEIPEQDKQMIFQAISVAASSYEFWMSKINTNL